MQQNLSVEPLPQFASQQEGSAHGAEASGIPQPLCGAFDPTNGFLLVGSATGAVTCIHLGRYGSVARRILGRHAGRVTSACVLPWRPPAAASAKSTGRPASFFATCSADATINLWTSDAKALHTTDPCLQTLRGHKAAITSLAAVQVAHTWCLLSGGADGQLLLWKTVAATDTAGQQLSGADMLAQLIPHMQLAEAALYTSPHWVLGIACALQQTGAGAKQGCFLALTQQPVLQVPISSSAVTDAAAGAACLAASAQAMQQQQQQRPGSPAGSRAATQQGRLQPSRLGCEPSSTSCATRHTLIPDCSSSAQRGKQQGPAAGSAGAAGGIAAGRSYCSSPSSTAPRGLRPGSAGSGNSSSYLSSCWSQGDGRDTAAAAAAASELPGTSHLSIVAVKFVPQQMAVLTLAYDGACRLHSVVEGLTRCCWRSPTGSSYVAMDVCWGPTGQVVLLGDSTGSLHLCSLVSEKLIATKQVASSRITAIVSCDTNAGLSACLQDSSSSSEGSNTAGAAAAAAGTKACRGTESTAGSSSGAGRSSGGGSYGSKGGSCVQFAVMSEDTVGLWQLRQGFSHGIVPGGHRQGVITLQLCCSSRPQAIISQEQQRANGHHTSPQPCASGCKALLAPAHGSSSSGHCGSSSSGMQVKLHHSSSSGGGGGGGSRSGSRMLISAGLDGRVIEWDLSGASPTAVQSLLASAGAEGRSEMTAMAYLESSCIAATGHDNGQVLLWHIDTGSHAALAPQGHSNSVSCLAPAMTAKGDEHLLSGAFDGVVCLWEPRQVRGVKPHLIARFQAHGIRPSSSLHLLEHYLQHPLNATQPQQHQQHHHHQQQHQQLRPSSAGKAVSRPVSSSSSRAVLSSQGKAVGPEKALCGSWLGMQQQQQQRLSGQVPFSNQGTAAASSINGSGKLPCQQATAACSSIHASSAGGSKPDCIALLAAAQECPPEVLLVLFEPINQVVLSGGNDGLIKVWSPSANGLLLGQHAGHMGPVLCMALDGNLLFSGSQDGTIRMWDAVPPLFNGRPATAGTAAAAKHSHDNSSCCHAARDTALMVLRGHSGSVVGLAVAAESGVLVSCGADGLVLQWDVSTGQQLGRCCLEGQVPACVAVEPDTRQVYVGTSQGQLLTIAGTEQVCAAHLQLVGCSSSP